MITVHDVKKIPYHGIIGLQSRLILLCVENGWFEINDPRSDWVFDVSSKVIARVPNSCSLGKGGKTAAKEELRLYKEFYSELIDWLLEVK